MGEVLEFEAEGDSKEISWDKVADINEILNYRKSMWHATELLEKLPLCQRVVKTAHQTLLQGVRGQGKSPGEYRKIPNWIGPRGCPIEDAKFIPISADKLDEAMGKWENYIHEDAPDILVQLAVLHAEFEALHPFLDGNGRLGRMCVPLFLFKAGLIQSPMFYISAYFEKNRDEYYDKLLSISRDNDWNSWCLFFLKAIQIQAMENQVKASKILHLYESKKNQLVDLTHSQYSIHALDFIFSRPTFKSTDFTSIKEIPTPTAKRILTTLRNNGLFAVLRESRGSSPAIYAFTELINIAEGKDIL